MKRVAMLLLAFCFTTSILLSQDKVAKQDSTKQEIKKVGCQMDCCCKKECKKDKAEMKKDCPKSSKEDCKK